MKSKRNTILFVALACLLAGIGMGYLIFGNSKGTVHTSEPTPHTDHLEYTCAMHPQIRQKEPGICPLCQMELTPLGQPNGAQTTQLTMSTEALKLADIETTVIGLGSAGEKNLKISGKIAADERLAIAQTTHFDGRIERLFTTFTGERVRKGQAIATMYSPELVNAQREFLEALRLKDNRPALLEAARTRLRSWKLPDAFISQLESSGKIQREVHVVADHSGIITSRQVSVGDYVKEGDVLFDMMDLSRVWALLEAYESDLPHLPLGSQVRITTPSVPGQSFLARITFVDPLLDPESRTVALRAELDNTKGLFKPGMFIEADARIRPTNTTALVVPKTAVLWTGLRSVVYVRQPNTTVPTFEFREVVLGASTDQGIQVLSGVQAGEEIVTQGVFAIDAAAQLNNQQSMMNRMVQAKNAGTTLSMQPPPIPPGFSSSWNRVLREYLLLKDNLVRSSPDEAARQAKKLTDALLSMPTENMPTDFQQWWQPRSGSLLAHARKISSNQQIKLQRKEFLFLSEVLIEVIQIAGKTEAALYIQHCPMAFNNQGGDWVSSQKEIRNPYFGDEMLTCGVVQDSFP